MSTDGRRMAVRAFRGATQLAEDTSEEMVGAVVELLAELFRANDIENGDLISAFLTATPDLHAQFPAFAARQLDLGDLPLLCAQEIDVEGALPRAVRVMIHAMSPLPRAEIRHVYLRGAVALRRDLAQ